MAIFIGLICLIIMENHVEARIDDLIEKTSKEHFEKISLHHHQVNIPRTSEDLVLEEKAAVLEEKADLPSNHNNVSTHEINPGSEPHNYCALDERDFIESELKRAKEEKNKYNFITSLEIYNDLALKYPDSPAALYGKINAFNYIATISGSTNILQSLREICLQYLALEDLVSDEDYKTMSYFCIKRLKLMDEIDSVIDIYLQLLQRFDDDLSIRNELAKIYMDLRRFSDAKDLLEENLKRWPNNGTTLAYYGYVAHFDKKWEETVHYLRLGLKTNEYVIKNRDYYSILGTSLLLLNRTEEGRKVFRKAVAMKLFPSEYQRPGSYIKDLKAQPIWTKEETPYIDVFNSLESNWRRIRDEGLSILNKTGYFKDQSENLTNFGVWKVFTLVNQGKNYLKNCESAQFTYGLFQSFIRHICYNCDVFFSVMYPGTHIIPHCGPHNVRLTTQLGLKVPNDTRIRIVEDERSWEEGKLLIFDDSFEHEAWNNGNGIRFVLVVDFWHPQVTDAHKEYIKRIGVYQTLLS